MWYNVTMDKMNMQIHPQFAAVMEKENMTTEDFQEEIGMSRPGAKYVLTGARVLSIGKLLEFARKHNTNLAYLLGMVTDDSPCERYTVNHRFTEIRKELGMKNGAFAAHCGITQTNLSSYNQDKSRAGSTRTLMTISKILDVSIDYILGLTEKKNWQSDDSAYPVLRIAPGEAGYLVTEGKFFLRSSDGQWLLFPDGSKQQIRSHLLIGKEVVNFGE